MNVKVTRVVRLAAVPVVMIAALAIGQSANGANPASVRSTVTTGVTQSSVEALHQAVRNKPDVISMTNPHGDDHMGTLCAMPPA